MSWQERDQMRGHTDRAHARTAAAVGNAEGLMQVDVTNVSAELGWPANPNLSIQVRAIHIYQAPELVYDPANVSNILFEDTMRGWICHHQASEAVSMRRRFLLQICDIDVTLAVAGDRHHPQTSHDRAGRIRSMRRS